MLQLCGPSFGTKTSMALNRLVQWAQKRSVVIENIESKSIKEDAIPKSMRLTAMGRRVPLEWLEQMYMRDADTFAAINHRVRTFMSSRWHIKCEDKKTQEWFEKFLKDARFDIVLKKIELHASIYGNAWVELVRDDKGKIVTFDHIDPKVMDFGRDSNGHILYNDYNNPMYYVQILPVGATVPENKEDRLVQHNSERFVDSSGYGIRLEVDEVSHFVLHTVGDQLDGIGLIEPMYNSLLSKIQMEKDWAYAVKKAAAPLVVAKVGDETHRPTKPMIDSMDKTVKNIQATSTITIPYYNDIDFKTADIKSLEPGLSYYEDKVAASTGVPKPYIIGSGDQTPRSTFKGLNLGYERDITENQRTIAYEAEVQIFSLIAEEYNLPEVPVIEWESVSMEYMDSVAGRLVDYVAAGIIVPDKAVRNIIRQKEGLPNEPDDIEELLLPKASEPTRKNDEYTEESVQEKPKPKPKPKR